MSCAFVGLLAGQGCDPDVPGWEAAVAATARRCAASPRSIEAGRLRVAIRADAEEAFAVDAGGRFALVDGTVWPQQQAGREPVPCSAADWLAAGDVECAARSLPGAWGGFSLVRYDDGRLLLAVDRFGLKPLFHARIPQGLAFSSCLRALAALLGAPALDAEALADVFGFRMLTASRSLIAGVAAVEPGGAVIVHGDGAVESQRYWRMAFDPRDQTPQVSEQDWVRRTEDALRSAVVQACAGAEHVNVFLSGGVDSSILAALVAASHPKATALTLEIDGFENPELERARTVAARLGLRHEVVRAPADAIAGNQAWLMRHLDQPPRHINNLALVELYRRAAQLGGPVVSGVAADAFFGASEPRRVRALMGRSRLRSILTPPVAAVLGRSIGAVVNKGRLARIGEALRDDLPTRCLRMERLEYGPVEDGLVAAATAGRLFSEDLGSSVWEGGDDLISRTRRLHLFLLSRAEFVRNDRIGAALGVETVYPFLHSEVFELARRLPDDMHYRDGRSKPVLRALCAQLVSAEVAYWSKMGFPSPKGEWLRGPLSPWTERLGRPDPILDPIVPSAARRRLDPDREFELIWTLLNLGALAEDLGLRTARPARAA